MSSSSFQAQSAAKRSVLFILIGAAVMLSLAMGVRQSLGIFMPSATKDIAITVSEFTLAVAAQNLLWGIFQPFAGAAAARFGYRPVMVFGAFCFLAGMLLLASADGLMMVFLGAGLFVGLAMACASVAMAMAVTAQVVSPERRSMMLGTVSAAGSVGALIAAPIGQALQQGEGWRVGVIGFAALVALMIPAAWMAGGVDNRPKPPIDVNSADRLGLGAALSMAASHTPFLVMSAAYFVCGMQLVFLTTHLPSYLQLCGMDPMLGAAALGTIGGFNVLGSLFFGWAGGRYNKQALLGGLYISRSLLIAWYFITPPSPESTIIFSAIIGFLWLGVSPLVAGSVVEMFGLKWQAMIQGLAFMNHQIGSFLGAFGGGWVYDQLGSYDLAVQVGVGLGLLGGFTQLIYAFRSDPRAPTPA